MFDHRQRLACACRRFAALERFARRRERFLEALDWACLDRRTAFLRERSDVLLASNLAQGRLYVAFLTALVREEEGAQRPSNSALSEVANPVRDRAGSESLHAGLQCCR